MQNYDKLAKWDEQPLPLTKSKPKIADCNIQYRQNNANKRFNINYVIKTCYNLKLNAAIMK